MSDELVHDPRQFNHGYDPAVVEEVTDDSTNSVSFANVDLHESGALICREWTDAVVMLPQWRWADVSYLRTERTHNEDGSKVRQRVHSDDWHRLPNIVREEIEPRGEAV